MLQKQCQLLHNQEMAPLQGCHVYASYPHVAMPEGILTWGGYDSPILFEDVLQDSATHPKNRHQRRSTSRASL